MKIMWTFRGTKNPTLNLFSSLFSVLLSQLHTTFSDSMRIEEAPYFLIFGFTLRSWLKSNEGEPVLAFNYTFLLEYEIIKRHRGIKMIIWLFNEPLDSCLSQIVFQRCRCCCYIFFPLCHL